MYVTFAIKYNFSRRNVLFDSRPLATLEMHTMFLNENVSHWHWQAFGHLAWQVLSKVTHTEIHQFCDYIWLNTVFLVVTSRSEGLPIFSSKIQIIVIELASSLCNCSFNLSSFDLRW